MSKRDQKWKDDQLMSLGGQYNSPVPGLRFVVPKACAPANKGTDDKAPGIYLIGNVRSSGPNIEPKHAERLLTRGEAIAYAAAVDTFAQPRPDQEHNSMFARDTPDDYYPATYEALVRDFYATLANRLDTAISQAEDRRLELRETRAAISGVA